MADHPRLSFVVPTFNRPAMLQEAVASCLAQTVPVEVVVVDHGSEAATVEVCESFGDDVTVVRRKRNSGPIFAWLDGVLHTSTEYVNLHFDDDLKHPRFAEECLDLMQDDVGMVFCQARLIDGFGNPTQRVFFSHWFSGSGLYTSHAFRRVSADDLVSPCAVLYRRSHLIDSLYVGELPNQRASYHGVGPDLYLQLLAGFRYSSVGYVAKDLSYFRSHPGSITIDAIASGRRKEFFAAYEDVRRHLNDLRVARVARSVGILGLLDAWNLLRRRVRRIGHMCRRRISRGRAWLSTRARWMGVRRP